MSQPRPPSPREEALNAVLRVRETYPNATISPDTWDTLLEIAWENRSQMGDRREIQRHLRQVLLESTRNGNSDDAAS
jgi:hypothetical protein